MLSFESSDAAPVETFSVVYVLTNPAMPGLVKIGRTAQADAKFRLDQLYGTGVPLPFDLVFASRVPNSAEVEKALHVAFGPQRINPKREFFKIDPEQAVAILKLLHVSGAADVTEEIEHQESSLEPEPAEKNAAKDYKARRPNLNFIEMGVPIGSVLVFSASGETAIVCAAKKVLFRGEETSLTGATRVALNIDYSIQPGAHWTHQGQTVKELYDATYEVPA